MPAKATITTRCPTCHARYQVPLQAVNHRANCPKCHTIFRVTEYVQHPTEDDILRWLNEGMEEYEFPFRRQIAEWSSDNKPSPVAFPSIHPTSPVATAS